MRNEPVIAGIAHGGIEKPVDDKRAGFLVHLVFDGLAADRHFDDDIDLARRIDPDRNGVNAHGWLRTARLVQLSYVGLPPSPRLRRPSAIVARRSVRGDGTRVSIA